MIDPVDKRAAEILAAQDRRLRARDDCADELTALLTAEAASATKYPVSVEREPGGVITLSYCKAMLGNTVRKEIAELHLRHGKADECQVVLSNAVSPPPGFDHGAWYEFDDAVEFVVRAMIESMAQSIAAGCEVVELNMDQT